MSQQWVGGHDGVAYPSPATWPPALICSGLALGRADLRPGSARELTKWAYIALGAGVGISVIVTAFVVVIGTSDTGQQH